ncbi:hypothetical protein HanRHA438_Chr11g0488451 [Helianthus annuus]|nr:hypothetical protein HanRHA438_Chr11g0488451 [Helianthus annuus]
MLNHQNHHDLTSGTYTRSRHGLRETLDHQHQRIRRKHIRLQHQTLRRKHTLIWGL